jgi:hypothetical protein
VLKRRDVESSGQLPFTRQKYHKCIFSSVLIQGKWSNILVLYPRKRFERQCQDAFVIRSASSAFNRFSYSELPDCANESSLDDGELETLRRAPAVLGGPGRGEGGESEPGDDCEACQDSSVSSSPSFENISSKL